MPNVLVISAVVFRNDAGDVLTVRKRGTSKFMLPGGKNEPDESALDCAIREIGEELGVVLSPHDVEPLGQWLAQAANEDDTLIDSTVFVTDVRVHDAHSEAEIEEIRWVPLGSAAPDLAPLLAENVMPLLT